MHWVLEIKDIADREPASPGGDRASVVVKFAETRPVRVKLDALHPTRFSAQTAVWEP
jgi:hypothetical protein